MNNNLAIIPARGGSKRLTNKNSRKLNGKELIRYTIEAVIQSEKFNKIIFSSDSEELLEIASKYKTLTLHQRDSELASDNSKVIDLVKFIVSSNTFGVEFERVGLFLPTCPFRTSKDIVKGIQLLDKSTFSVVSATEMTDPIQLAFTINDDKSTNLNAAISPSPLVTGNTRSQDFEKYFRVNGGFYIAWYEEFKRKNNFFDGTVKAHIMTRNNSIDIDEEIDLRWAEYLLLNNLINN